MQQINLEKMLGSKTKIIILRELASKPNWQFSISELARDLKLDKSLISRVVATLENMNVIKIIYKGRVKLVRINKENEIVQSIITSLFEAERTIFEQISKTLIKKLKLSKINSIIIYGSAVKGTLTPASDIDVMFIAKKTKEIEKKLFELAQEIRKKDIIISYDILSENEFRKLYKQKVPMIISLVKNHRKIYGKDLVEVLT